MKKLFVIIFLMISFNSYAGVEVHTFSSEVKEQQYKKLIKELRCLVCQNQNLADSNAELAKDLRNQIYEMINADSSEEEIIQYMVARYGDFILYRPPLNKYTFLLWLGPFLIFIIGLLVLVKFIRRQKTNQITDIGDDQHKRIKKLLNEEADD